MKIENDGLLNLLTNCRKRPALICGVQSVRALENYVDGYIHACRQNDSNCLTLQWYDAFMRFLIEKLSIQDEVFSVSTRLYDLGYTDEDAAVYYLELLEQFLFECNEYIPLEQISSLKPGEVRAFRFSRHKEMELFSKHIRNNCAQYFGVEQSKHDTLTFIHMDDGSVVCALSNQHMLSEADVSHLPVVDVAERIQYQVLCL